MSTTVNYVVEVKKNGEWQPAVPLSFKENPYDNNWILECGGTIYEILREHTANLKAFPEDSPIISQLEFMYPSVNPPKWVTGLRNTCMAAYQKVPGKIVGKPLIKAINKLRGMENGCKGIFDGIYAYSYITISELQKIGDGLLNELTDSIDTYANENKLIQMVREAVGKPADDGYYMTMDDITDFPLYRYGLWRSLLASAYTLAAINGIYEPDDIRIIWWVE